MCFQNEGSVEKTQARALLWDDDERCPRDDELRSYDFDSLDFRHKPWRRGRATATRGKALCGAVLLVDSIVLIPDVLLLWFLQSGPAFFEFNYHSNLILDFTYVPVGTRDRF